MSGILGCAWQANSLANLEVGKQAERQISGRFVAEQAKALKGSTHYIKTAPNYSLGTGGSILCTLRPDDGTPDHFPSDFVIDYAAMVPGNPASTPFKRFAFQGNFVPTVGGIYHLVMSNLDADPVHNYVSINNLNNKAMTPQRGDLSGKLAILRKDSSATPWYESKNLTPIFSIDYADGSTQGQAYSDALSSSGLLTLGDSVRAREVFTVKGGDKTITGLYAFVKSNCKATVTDLSGTEAIAAVASSKVLGGTDFAWASSSMHGVLRDGHTYAINLFGTGQVYSLVKNQIPATPSVFDGHMEQTSDGGRTWTSQPNRDLMAYLTYA